MPNTAATFAGSVWTQSIAKVSWRRQQEEALAALAVERINGSDRAWVVLPPGAGKTLVGLETARVEGRTTLILSPNTAIQSQWASSANLFDPPLPVSTDKSLSKPITALTYQSIAVFTDTDTNAAHGHIPRLHENGKMLIARLAEINDLLVVLDEAHHLLATWGELVAEILDLMPNAKVLGLTGTPPQRMSDREKELFNSILGDPCYVASPNAVIRDGGTAPYQDLHYFVVPTANESALLSSDPSLASVITGQSGAKPLGAIEIVKQEHANRAESLRALVLCDFETMQSNSPARGAGSAEAALTAFIADDDMLDLDPVMVTGSRVMCAAGVADDIAAWMGERYPQISLDPVVADSMDAIVTLTGGWNSREWVAMITEWFQTQTGRVLIGTRALLGEGWDAPAVNVVIDLTTASTSVSVTQSRGRGLRINRADSGKVASLWTVTCIDPTAAVHPDYDRLMKKASAYFTVDKGTVVQGTALIPVLKRLTLDGINGINAGMLAKSSNLTPALRAWRVGENYRDLQTLYVDIACQSDPRVALRYLGSNGYSLTNGTFAIRNTGQGMAVRPGQCTIAESIACAVADGLQRLGYLSAGYQQVRKTLTADGCTRFWLDTKDTNAAAAFQKALAQCFDLNVPADAPHYPAHAVPLDVYNTVMDGSSRKSVTLSPLTSYHPIPGVFRSSYDAVTIFFQEWQRWVGPADTDVYGSIYVEWTGGSTAGKQWN